MLDDVAQWLVEEAATLLFEREQANAPEPGVSETTAAHERIVAAAREGRLVT